NIYFRVLSSVMNSRRLRGKYRRSRSWRAGSTVLEKRQRADFDALARPRVGRRGRIVESGVGGPAGAAVLLRIVDLEHQRLLAAHARQPVPAVRGIVGYGVGLADAVGITALAYQKIVERDAARIADAEREALDRMADRPPHLHDGETALQQRVGLLRQQVAHALRAGPFGVIVVRAAHDLADLARLALVVVGGAQGMVEDDD